MDNFLALEPRVKWAYNVVWDALPLKEKIKPKNWKVWYNAKLKDPWRKWNDIRTWYKSHKDPIAYTVDKAGSMLIPPAI